MQDEPAIAAQEDDHNDTNMGERMTTMSPFERLMINRMDTFADNQRNLYGMCESRFSNMDTHFSTLDEQIEEVQRQILELQLKGRIVLLSSSLLSNFFFLMLFFNPTICLFDETNRGRSIVL